MSLRSLAQDPHFSQYFASPLTLNPANTGFFDGDQRIAVNERQQWWNVGDNYNTTSISADVKIAQDRLPDHDVLAIGFSGVFDRSLNAALQSDHLSVSAAYHKSLAAEGSQMLTMGMQFSFASRYLDLNKLTFASQFNRDFFDPTISVGTNFANTSVRYAEFHGGLLYAVHLARANIYAGTSLYHINRANESLFDGPLARVPFRYTAHAGGEIFLNEASSILFSGLYMRQAAIKEQLIGGAYAFGPVNDPNMVKMYLGFWYRVNESYIPYIGLDYNSFGVGINYSTPVASIGKFRPNAFELSLTYKFKNRSDQSSLCPRF